MADQKLSALTAATTPLAGTEDLYIVQGGTSKKVAASAFQAPLVSGTSIKTVNGNSLLGSGDLTVSASAAGSDTQVQFNNSGALGGDAGLAYNATTKALTVGGGTVTTSNPVIDASQTWNAVGTTFTGVKFNATNTASAAGSLLMDLQVGGAGKLAVRKDGAILTDGGAAYKATMKYGADAGGGGSFYIGRITLEDQVMLGAYGLTLGNSTFLSFKSGAVDGANFGDVYLHRDAANTLAQRNGANAQEFRLYNTYPDASNTEYCRFKWDTNVLKIGTFKTGTGAARALELQTDGVTRASFDASSHSLTLFGGGRGRLDISATGSGNDPVIEANAAGSLTLTLRAAQQVVVESVLTVITNVNRSLRIDSTSIRPSDYQSDFTIQGPGRSIDEPLYALQVIGAPASTTATTNLRGGNVFIKGGAGASASSGNAHGGNVYVRGGNGYGTGHVGYVIMDNLPTSNPAVAGALWNDAGTLKVSAG